MKQMIRMFSDHPASVGETYGEHAAFASGYGLRMVLCGLACMIHGVLPFLFVKTGTNCVRNLHNRIATGPRAQAALPPHTAAKTS